MCLMYFPALNTTACCKTSICTECHAQVRYAETPCGSALACDDMFTSIRTVLEEIRRDATLLAGPETEQRMMC